MKKISLLILLSTFLISCNPDCDCKKYKAKYKMHHTEKVLMDGVEKDSIYTKRDSLKRMKMKKIRKWRKAKRDSIKN